MLSFNYPDYEINIHDITAGNTAKLKDMIEVFEELMPDFAFSTPTILANAERPPDFNPNFYEHQWLVEVNGKPAGMTVFKLARKRNVGFGDFLCIRSEYRKICLGSFRRLSELIIDVTRAQLQQDAITLNIPEAAGYVVEIVVDALRKRYHEYGLIDLPVSDYRVPMVRGGRMSSLSAEELRTLEFHKADLGLYPLAKQPVPLTRELISNCILALLVDHYEIPEDHWSIAKAIESINL